VGEELAKLLSGEPVGIYAGAGKSGIFRGDDFASVEREEIKKAVKTREIRLVVATDAACEGLNLQTLGTLINVDLPWNPSRLEQRLGRIKRSVRLAGLSICLISFITIPRMSKSIVYCPVG
jgi:superfamily II DNA/RNA helicase